MFVLRCLQHLATFVSHLLEPRIATMTMIATVALGSLHLSPTAAAIVLRVLHSHVSQTQPLEPDSGTLHFARKKAVAVKVS